MDERQHSQTSSREVHSRETGYGSIWTEGDTHREAEDKVHLVVK